MPNQLGRMIHFCCGHHHTASKRSFGSRRWNPGASACRARSALFLPRAVGATRPGTTKLLASPLHLAVHKKYGGCSQHGRVSVAVKIPYFWSQWSILYLARENFLLLYIYQSVLGKFFILIVLSFIIKKAEKSKLVFLQGIMTKKFPSLLCECNFY